MKRLGGNDSQVSLQVTPYDKDSNSAVTVHLSANPHSASLQQELAIASEVQKASFPQRPPDIPGVNFATFYKPALSLGAITMISSRSETVRGASPLVMCLEKESAPPWFWPTSRRHCERKRCIDALSLKAYGQCQPIGLEILSRPFLRIAFLRRISATVACPQIRERRTQSTTCATSARRSVRFGPVEA